MTRPAVFAEKSYADALEASMAAGKLLLVDATASWCQPCQVMDRVTWVDPNVVTWLAAHALAVQIDVDQEKPVAASLGIRSMPTVVVFRGGVEIDRAVGLKRPAELLSWLTALDRGETSVDRARKTMEAGPKDMQARMAFARTLSGARRYEEATAEYVWLWQHVLEHAIDGRRARLVHRAGLGGDRSGLRSCARGSRRSGRGVGSVTQPDLPPGCLPPALPTGRSISREPPGGRA